METDINRLSRIEDDLREIKKMVERLVRVEERQSGTDAANHRMAQELDDHERRIRIIETNQNINRMPMQWLTAIFWIIIGGAVVSVAKLALQHGIQLP